MTYSFKDVMTQNVVIICTI